MVKVLMNLCISTTEITPYQKAFNKPFTIAGHLLTIREGLILTIKSGDFIGQGEASPLEGFSVETYKKAQYDLSIIVPQLLGINLPSNSFELVDFLRYFPLLENVCPSVRFAVESAIFDLVSQSHEISLGQFLGATIKDFSSAALLQGTSQEIIDQAKELLHEGYKVFKLKVGSRNIPLDVKKVKDLREVLPSDALIRLDANRAWGFNEAVVFGELIGTERIEFIEEPLSDMGQVNRFFEQTQLPVALDESLSIMHCGILAPGRCTPTLAHIDAVKAYILKPTILGGITPTMDWIEEAKAFGKLAIISSCFESVIGFKILANVSLLTNQVSGLGTGRWLGEGNVLI